MKFTILPCLIILNISFTDAAALFKSLSSDISTGKQLNDVARRDAFPGLPGTAFTDNNAMEAALAAAPIFLYAKDSGQVWQRHLTLSHQVWHWAHCYKAACYPESAIKIGSDPPEKNPGTDGPLGPVGIWPGEDCTDPGPYYGSYVKAPHGCAIATKPSSKLFEGQPFSVVRNGEILRHPEGVASDLLCLLPVSDEFPMCSFRAASD